MRFPKLRQSIRFAVLERDQFRCRYCGRGVSDVRLAVDHVHPRSKGGSDELSNLVTACWDCNTGKGARLLRPVPAKRRRYGSTEPTMVELRLRFPEGSFCATPLRIASHGYLTHRASYAQALKQFAFDARRAEPPIPVPPLRRKDVGWWRVVLSDPMPVVRPLIVALSEGLSPTQ